MIVPLRCGSSGSVEALRLLTPWGRFCVLGKLYGIGCVVAACARYNGNSLCNTLDSVANALPVLVVGECGGFARCASDYDSVGAACQLHIYQLAQRVVINAAVGIHGGYYSNSRTCEYGIFHIVTAFRFISQRTFWLRLYLFYF